jgi:type I restriction enzyme S subunit
MTNWKTCKLSDVVSLISGFAYKSSDWKDSGVPVLKITNVRNGRARLEGCSFITEKLADETINFQINKGDLLITLTGEIGATGFYSEDFEARLNQRVGRLIPKSEVDVNLRYVAYFLESPLAREIMWSTAKGIAQANISPKEVLGLDIPLPSIDEQHKIVELLEDHLSRLDAALADVKQARIKSAQFRRSLLQAAFTGNIGSDGVTPFTEWQTKTVGELADTQLGKMLNKGKQSGNYAKPYLRTDNVHWGRFDLSEIKEMDILPEEREKYLATKGDLLMCEGGASGRTAIWNEDYDISFQNHVHRIRPKDPEVISPKYLLYYFEWFIKNGYASELIKGVTISSLSQSGLRSIAVTYPLIEEQYIIVEHLEDHLSRLDASVSLADAMEKQSNGLRRSLLQAAFTGHLTKEVVSV